MLRTTRAYVETGAMPVVAPWYTRRWRKLASGRRAVLGVWCYLTCAAVSLIVAALSHADAATRVGWAVIGAVWAFIGLSLLATLRHRARSSERSDA